jgi:hypothetical protein
MVNKNLKVEEIKWKMRNVKDDAFLRNTRVTVIASPSNEREFTLRELKNQPNNLDARINENDWLKLVCKNNVKNDFTDEGRKVLDTRTGNVWDSWNHPLRKNSVKVGDQIYGAIASPMETHPQWGGSALRFKKGIKTMDTDCLVYRNTGSGYINYGKCDLVDFVNVGDFQFATNVNKELVFDLEITRVSVYDQGGGAARHRVFNIQLSPRQLIYDQLRSQGVNNVTTEEIEKSFSIGYDQTEDYTNLELQPYRQADIPKYIAERVIEMRRDGQGDQTINTPFIDSNLISLIFNNSQQNNNQTSNYWLKLRELLISEITDFSNNLNITPKDLTTRYGFDYQEILRTQTTPSNPSQLYDEYKEILKVMVCTLATEQAEAIANQLNTLRNINTNSRSVFSLTRRLLDKLARTRSAWRNTKISQTSFAQDNQLVDRQVTVPNSLSVAIRNIVEQQQQQTRRTRVNTLITTWERNQQSAHIVQRPIH